jgi:cell division protein FtsZ
VDGATGLIINVTGGPDLTAFEVNEATTLIMEAAHEDAEIIFGSVIDEAMKNRVKITVIATGIGANAQINQIIGGGVSLERPAAPLSSLQAPNLGAGTQAESLSVVAKTAQAAPQVPERPVVPPAPPAVPQPPVQQAKPAGIDNIIPSASLDEVDAEIDALSKDDMFSSMEEADEALPRPASAARPVSPSSPTPATKMEQVEMFEEKSEARAPAKEEGIGAKARDNRSESLARAQQIARSLGVTNLTDDEYDIPTFIRRQQQNHPNN